MLCGPRVSVECPSGQAGNGLTTMGPAGRVGDILLIGGGQFTTNDGAADPRG